MSSSKENNHGARKGTGRKKIKMEKIANKSNLKVTFSKRRAGIFKKTNELAILCGAEVAVIIFSPSKKVYSYASSSVNKIARRFAGIPTSPNRVSDEARRAKEDRVSELNQILAQLELKKKRAKELKSKPRLDINKMSLEALQKLRDVLVKFQQEFDVSIQKGKNLEDNHTTRQNLNLGGENTQYPKVGDRKFPVTGDVTETAYMREMLKYGKHLSLGISGSSSQPWPNQSDLYFVGRNCISPQFVDLNRSYQHFAGPSFPTRQFLELNSSSSHFDGSSHPIPNFGFPLSGLDERDVVPHSNSGVHDDEATTHGF